MTLAFCLLLTASTIAQEWLPVGPSPIEGGQVENITPNDEVNGAINAVQTHPTNPDIIFIGGVNSGVWKTENATALNPTWVHLTDTFPSLAAAELNLDPTDATWNTLVVGMGRSSSLSGLGGDRIGLLRTTDGGATWTHLHTLAGSNISGVASRGTIIVAAANTADSGSPTGLFRSTDSGANFTQIAVGDGSSTGLPAGIVYDLFGDPNTPSRLYLVNGQSSGGGVNGVYQSDDTGATWTKISDSAVDAALAPSLSRAEIAVGASGGIVVGICQSGSLSSMFHSANGGALWTSMDVSNIHPGGQASIHFSIAIDPTNSNIVYVGGDRQAAIPGPFGAQDWSGNLMRCDASLGSGSQCVHLTHRDDLGPSGGGTANSSSPHADSRDMAFDANGNLIETDDGGIYRRTSPLDNTGDWFSILGNIQGTEHHNIAYDSNSNIILGGAQDNGTESQQSTGSSVYDYDLSGDGGDVAVDDYSTPGQSTRFFSSQGLGNFVRVNYDATNTYLGHEFASLTTVSGAAISPAFVNPVELNSVNADRILFLANNGLYESLDQGDTLTQLSASVTNSGVGTDPIAYGAADNADVIYAGTGQEVWVRMSGFPNPPTQSATYPGGGSIVRDIAIHPQFANTAFVASSYHVYMTENGGSTWTDITGNLDSINGSYNRSLVYIPDDSNAAIVVGTRRGAFIARESDSFSFWTELGNLPRAPVYDLDYDLADDILVAGTLGRGDWMMHAPLDPACTLPDTPTSPSALTGTSITVSWSGTAPGYDVFRAEGPCGTGTFTQVATNTPDLTYVDSSVTPGTIYSYQIRATTNANGDCVSDFTDCVEAITCGDNQALYPDWGETVNILDLIPCI